MRTQAIMLAATLCVAGCASLSKTTEPPQATKQQPASGPLTTDTAPAPRVITVDGKEVSEADAGEFTSWVCQDYLQRGNIVVEAGFFNHPQLDGVGFVLYDGGNTGELASYKRAGLLHRWDWGWNDTRYVYSFLIKPDGTGLFYDFSSAIDGYMEKADNIFRCQSR